MFMKHFDTIDALEQFLREPLAAVPRRESFPPYDILTSKDGNTTQINVAVAGFQRDEIEVEFVDGKIHLRGQLKESENPQWDIAHKGIASRRFALSFVVNRGFEPVSAEMENGILSITLNRVEGFSKKLEIKPRLHEAKPPELLTG